MLRLNRITLFLLGLVVIMICYFARQLTFIASAEITEGTVINVTNSDSISLENTALSYPMVEFNANGNIQLFRAESNMNVTKGDKVKVIYQANEPSDAYIYSFTGFWLRNILWFIIPLVLWAAFSLSYLNRDEGLSLKLRTKRRNDKNNHRLPHDWNENKRIE